MAFTAGPFNPLSGLRPGKDTWKVKVRVLRHWEMVPVADASKPYAINLVLIDSQGVKIEAYIKKNYLPKFRGEFIDGGVYKITYFSVAENSGAFRASEHMYKIFFNSRTRVVADSSDLIPTIGLTLKDSAYIESTLGESDFLIDYIGLLTAVSAERQYVKSGNITRKIELDLVDDNGKVRCALFGNYVDIVKEFCSNAGVGLPVVVVQFAKIKSFRGDIVIQNVTNGTQILWDPVIPEVTACRAGLAAQGIDINVPIGVIDAGVQHVALDKEFLTMYPRKSVQDLHSTEEEGIFIVYGKVSGLIDGEKWWYLSCRCHKSVGVEDGMYYCKGCAVFVMEVIPRFRIKIEVSDVEEAATFVLFDDDSQYILQRSCKDLVAVCKSTVEYPEVLKALVGNEYLFKVEKTLDHGVKYDDSFKVKKICDNIAVIDKFKRNTQVQTPKKLMTEAFVSKFSAGTNVPPLNEIVPDDSGELSEIGPSTVSLDDISPVECSSVLSSVGSAGGNDASTSKPAKRMRLRNS